MGQQDIKTKPEVVITASKEYDRLTASVFSLLNYCRENDWAGFDPYDALNSRLFACTPFTKSRICRIAITQILKRLPINIRPLLLIAKEQNPKAIALFLDAFVRLSRLGLLDQEDLVAKMIERLIALRSQNSPYWCWGYSFPWQTRTVLVPRGAPNLVCTVFVANALLDAYKETNDSQCLAMAVSAAEYVLNELYWTEGDSVAGFSYPLPAMKARVHNANFLGAALFCRIYHYSGDEKFIAPALRVARYSANKQHDDGSWDYGELSKQRWVDNFHTGYNLCALQTINSYLSTTEFAPHIQNGYSFYLNNFFREDGAPKYFHNRTYPLDIHSVAQSIITLVSLKEFDDRSLGQAFDVFEWSMSNLWDKKGFAHYHIQPLFKNRISYMRWSQAWMLLSLTYLLKYTEMTQLFPKSI
jgi:hypothetical protein